MYSVLSSAKSDSISPHPEKKCKEACLKENGSDREATVTVNEQKSEAHTF